MTIPVRQPMLVILRIALAAASGALFALSLPPHDWEWLGWVAFVPLLFALRHPRLRPDRQLHALGFGLICGLVCGMADDIFAASGRRCALPEPVLANHTDRRHVRDLGRLVSALDERGGRGCACRTPLDSRGFAPTVVDTMATPEKEDLIRDVARRDVARRDAPFPRRAADDPRRKQGACVVVTRRQGV